MDSYTDPDALMEGTLLLSSSHIIALLIGLSLILLLYFLRNREKAKVYGRWGIFGALLMSEAWLNYWYLSTDMWDIAYTLPFQLCSISLYLCMWMLITKQSWTFEVVYFLGLGGALQALLTPELFYDFPHFRFIHFFMAHTAIILSVFYMLWVEKKAITFKSMVKAFVALQFIAGLVFFINALTGGNYMFLARKPSNASIIDLLGPYPWYILSLEFVVIIMFFILYVPLQILKKKASQNIDLGKT
nr:TIGR02206 family membrane protein [Bacillus tianshenii]